jgi:hypothetical protein
MKNPKKLIGAVVLVVAVVAVVLLASGGSETDGYLVRG